MPDPIDDVQPDSSTGSQEPVQSQTPDPAQVNAGVTEIPDDRPAINLKAEFDRKFSSLSQQMQDLMAVLASGPANQPKPQTDYSDEQLGELARAGSLEASLKLQERVATRAAQSVVSSQTQIQLVQSQLAKRYAQYPQLHNPSDPLTIEAMKAKHLLIRSGRNGQDPATDLEAIGTAIVDHPHLITKPTQPAQGEFTRQQSTRPQQSMDGNTTRKTQPSTKPGRKITDPKVLAVAQRMGVNPDEAMARFEERQKKGQSSVSPMVGMIIREQD